MVVNWLFSPNVTLVRLPQSLKAPVSMMVTLFGITILVKPVQLWKVFLPMANCAMYPNVTLVKLRQLEKAPSPMVVKVKPEICIK